MSTLVDAADVNPAIKLLPHTLQHLTVTYIERKMLQRVWQELDYRIDICSVTKGGHIEHL
jgi:hypothetical protein